MSAQPHPRDLDSDVRPFKLPENLRREGALAAHPVQQAQREPSFLERLDASIRKDPLKQIACTICYLRFKDMVQLSKEICELTEAPQGSDAEVLALKHAVKLHAWAEAKFPADAEQ